jgi:uncharacterized OB-fold protein
MPTPPTTAATGEIDEPFWLALGDGQVKLPRCSSCSQWVWPARPFCPHCLTATLRWVQIMPEGLVYTWTRTWYPFVPWRADDLPYVAIVFDVVAAGNAKMIGVLEGSQDGLEIGAGVRGRIVPPSDRSLGLPSVVWELSR